MGYSEFQVAPDQLVRPPKLPNETLRIVPLGGLGEVGRNMTVFEISGKLLIVDCGVLFPEDSQPGVDVILPDFSYIKDRMHDVVALILTHGHEDHIGGVPYLLRLRPDIPVVGSKLTLALVEAKLQEFKMKPKLEVVKEGETRNYGPFSTRFVAVNHSIPDALALRLKTRAGTVFHTGDFKMDQLPLDGRITDLREFGKIGEEGLDLYLADSTNAENPGFTTGEQEIGPVLEGLFGDAPGRIMVASFSSHIHRVQQVLDAAKAHSRKVAFAGRSMVRNMKIAQDLGYLHVPDKTLIDVNEIDSLPDEQVVLMSTGSQGEPMAALSRMATGDHQVNVGEGDTVILASSLIPGNEHAVFRVINSLMKRGANVIHKGNAKVHTSGHASAGELLYTYNILKPKNAMPVHGETRHLIANGEIAESSGIAPENILICDDGTVVDIRRADAKIVGQVSAGYVYVDGKAVGSVDENDLKDRRILSEEGFISVIVPVDKKTGKVTAEPEIHSRGFAESGRVFKKVKPMITEKLEQSMAENPSITTQQMQQIVRRTTGAWVSRQHRRRPMIVPVVVET